MKTFLPIIILSLCCFSVFAQKENYFQNKYEYSGKAYWTAKTNPVNGNTVILFFDKHNELLYREELLGQLVKPTKRNIKRFDKILKLMAENKLVTNQLATVDFPAETNTFNLSSIPEFSTNSDNDSLSIQTRIFTHNTGKLIIYIFNPKKDRVKISLTDSKQRVVHTEYTSVLKYGRDFNIQQLEPGQYKLLLQADNVRKQYEVAIGTVEQYEVTQIAIN